MSLEITLLVWSAVLAGGYIGVQSVLYWMDYGGSHGAGPRDNDRAPGLWAGRGERALRNFCETYPVFVALAVVVGFGGRADGLTQWGSQLYFWARWVYLPLYIFGVPYMRSLVWLVSALGLALMFFGVAF
jgi:uncharacterized MAPEG superfamily protein